MVRRTRPGVTDVTRHVGASSIERSTSHVDRLLHVSLVVVWALPVRRAALIPRHLSYPLRPQRIRLDSGFSNRGEGDGLGGPLERPTRKTVERGPGRPGAGGGQEGRQDQEGRGRGRAGQGRQGREGRARAGTARPARPPPRAQAPAGAVACRLLRRTARTVEAYQSPPAFFVGVLSRRKSRAIALRDLPATASL